MINNKIKFVVMLSALVVIAYLLTQTLWLFFFYFHSWETFKNNIWLYDILTKVAGIVFLVSTSTILAYKLFRYQVAEKKEVAMKTKKVTVYTKNIIKNLRRILKKAKEAVSVLTTKVIPITRFLYLKIARFLYRSRKMVLLIAAIALVTTIFIYLIFLYSWFTVPIEQERDIPTTGTIYVRGLEIYGGDIKSNRGNITVDWGELTLGSIKNASFNVKSTSNVDVQLGLNVTDWEPAGIEKYLTISWNYNGTLLSPNQELFVTANLEVSSSPDFIDFLVENNVTEFGFNMTIYASGV
jgi:hypothetical protein